jgi:hypothetical protein
MSNIKQEQHDEMQDMLGNCLVLLDGNLDQEIPEPILGANMLDDSTRELISNLRWNLKDPKQNERLAELAQEIQANRLNRYKSPQEVKISGPIMVAVPLDGAKENYEPAFILVIDYLTFTNTPGVTTGPDKAHPCKKHLCAVAVPPLRSVKKGNKTVSEFDENGSVVFYQIPSPLYLDNMILPRKSSDGKVILVKNSAVKNTKWRIQVEDDDAPTWMPLPKFLGLPASCKTSEVYERFVLDKKKALIRGQVAINVSLEYSFSPNRRDQKPAAAPLDSSDSERAGDEEECDVKRSRARSRSPQRSKKSKSAKKSDKKLKEKQQRREKKAQRGKKHKESSKTKDRRAKLLAQVAAAEQRIAALGGQIEAN